MPRAAVALANSPRRPNALRITRVHLGLIALAVISVWLALVFARSLADLDKASTRQAQIAAESSALAARLAADKREYALVQTDAFQALQARAYGIGAPGEQVFSLAPGAPPPPPITPLGNPSAGVKSAPSTPLDAWLEILFGT
jgi:cell division protein FtsB